MELRLAVAGEGGTKTLRGRVKRDHRTDKRIFVDRSVQEEAALQFVVAIVVCPSSRRCGVDRRPIERTLHGSVLVANREDTVTCLATGENSIAICCVARGKRLHAQESAHSLLASRGGTRPSRCEPPLILCSTRREKTRIRQHDIRIERHLRSVGERADSSDGRVVCEVIATGEEVIIMLRKLRQGKARAYTFVPVSNLPACVDTLIALSSSAHRRGDDGEKSQEEIENGARHRNPQELGGNPFRSSDWTHHFCF